MRIAHAGTTIVGIRRGECYTGVTARLVEHAQPAGPLTEAARCDVDGFSDPTIGQPCYAL